MAKLISEYRDLSSMKTIVEESTDGSAEKKYYITGSFLKTDTRNQNGNLYPHDVAKRCIDQYVEEKVSKNRAIGELNHPHTPEIDLERIAVIIEDLHFEGNDLIGRARVVHQKIKDLIDEGLNFGVSLRALGSLDSDKVMQDGMQLIAIDVVADPSFATAFVNPILESKEYNIMDDGKIVCSDGVCTMKNKEISEESKQPETTPVGTESPDTAKVFEQLFNYLKNK